MAPRSLACSVVVVNGRAAARTSRSSTVRPIRARPEPSPLSQDDLSTIQGMVIDLFLPTA
jgi:hypothetical protein